MPNFSLNSQAGRNHTHKQNRTIGEATILNLYKRNPKEARTLLTPQAQAEVGAWMGTLGMEAMGALQDIADMEIE